LLREKRRPENALRDKQGSNSEVEYCEAIHV
jgi:hypothetical protein